jgi:hypothetical protein
MKNQPANKITIQDAIIWLRARARALDSCALQMEEAFYLSLNKRKSVLSDMKTDSEVIRQPVVLDDIRQEIDDVFVFNPPMSLAHQQSCEKIQTASKALAQVIAEEVPVGKEQTIAINNLLSAVLFARHGITKRQVMMMAAAEEPLPPIPVTPETQPSAPSAAT